MRQQQRLTADEIKQLVDAYRAREEMTRPEFCESRGMTVSKLDYYLRLHKQTSRPITRLAKVKVKSEPDGIRGFALVLANGRRIECGGAELAGLIRVAEAV